MAWRWVCSAGVAWFHRAECLPAQRCLLHCRLRTCLTSLQSRGAPQPLQIFLQGGLDERLRDISLKGLVARGTPGYAIGGLAGGEDKRSFVK